MVDTVSAATRSRIMRLVKSKGSKPEMSVRRLLHGLGYRYRLHRADLPGRPDLAFPSRHKVVFVKRVLLAPPRGLHAGSHSSHKSRLLAGEVSGQSGPRHQERRVADGCGVAQGDGGFDGTGLARYLEAEPVCGSGPASCGGRRTGAAKHTILGNPAAPALSCGLTTRGVLYPNEEPSLKLLLQYSQQSHQPALVGRLRYGKGLGGTEGQAQSSPFYPPLGLRCRHQGSGRTPLRFTNKGHLHAKVTMMS